MTMATYCKKRLTKSSSKYARKERAVKSKCAPLVQVKDEVPYCNAKTSNVNSTSRLCSRSSCYDVLEALGLKRINLKCEVYVKDEEICSNPNNNNVNLKNKNISQDKNNNTKTVAKMKLRKCIKCNLSFKSALKYNQHRKQNHPRTRILYCKICSKTFRKVELLLKHKKCHSGDQPYCCVRCNKTFGALQSLTAHIRRHAGISPYTCKICKMGFDLYSDYLDHQPVHLLRKSDYIKPKIYKCTICPKEFRKLCDLERHTRVHTGEKPYICNICENRFQQAHNLTKHMIIHTKEKQFKCEICNKQFGRSDVLTRHMITHSVNKPHPCEVCTKSFGRLSQLNEHVKKHHSNTE